MTLWHAKIDVNILSNEVKNVNDENDIGKTQMECKADESCNFCSVKMGNVTYQVHRAFGGAQTVEDLLVDCILFQSGT